MPVGEAHHLTAAGDIVVPETHDIEVRALTPADLADALRRGYADFRAKPSYILVLVLFYPLGAAVAAGVALGYGLLPLVFPIASGMALLGPFAAIVLYHISRRRELGRPFSWNEVGRTFQRTQIGAVAILTGALFAAFFLWLLAAQAIFDLTIGYAAYLDPLELIDLVLTTPEGWTLIIIGHAVGFVFAAVVLAANVVSFPMLLDRPVGAPAAVITSLRVTFKSPLTIALWGLIIAVSMAAGTALFLIGLGIVVPVIGHATWHLYRKAVAEPPNWPDTEPARTGAT